MSWLRWLLGYDTHRPIFAFLLPSYLSFIPSAFYLSLFCLSLSSPISFLVPLPSPFPTCALNTFSDHLKKKLSATHKVLILKAQYIVEKWHLEDKMCVASDKLLCWHGSLSSFPKGGSKINIVGIRQWTIWEDCISTSKDLLPFMLLTLCLK